MLMADLYEAVLSQRDRATPMSFDNHTVIIIG